MTIDILDKFFLWSSVINLACSLLVFIVVIVGRKFVYRIHSKLYGVSEEKVAETVYSSMVMYKSFVVFFNIIPYIAIQIIK